MPENLQNDYFDEETARKQKLENLRTEIKTPYPARVKRSHTIKKVLDDFSSLEKSDSKIIGIEVLNTLFSTLP